MLYHFLYSLKDTFSPLNIFQYITFRSASAAILALVISFILGPAIIRKLRQYQIGEEIREHGPESHKKKRGTPTMGGDNYPYSNYPPHPSACRFKKSICSNNIDINNMDGFNWFFR